MSGRRVLVVDDEPLNVEMLVEALEEAGFDYVAANDGQDAWEKLEADGNGFDVVLLDRMMPRMNGIELLKRLKATPRYAMIPVIMQTARAANEDLVEGLEAGAHYYLAKPFDDRAMLQIVQAAADDYARYRGVREQTAQSARALTLLNEGRFVFRTLGDARDLAGLLANLDADSRLAVGLLELFINAVEHGNLGIGYAEKSRLQAGNEWEREIDRRLSLEENATKHVEVSFARDRDEIRFRVCDQGAGFDWSRFMEFSAERAFDSHGRGIAMARALSFKSIEYRGKGNEVEAVYSARGAGGAARE